ncbi:DHH family phosphoesterase [Texcoconibacillus texcoconensis]|uniref:Phosphoesterase RecJ-like protein n=1 Tax=Texcoconibacillus texcoconensis TaxID=1095777 RepID=A0A840QMX8_9BACI|nr:bifunctional oligoribonuclease/PAP phosphatase NrnA [Texcoconibacillus texcoconensis]MBB5172734.1 phosphoesterase RecJ-like protein [Texcoconibacillus texcoconensis]
MKQEIKNMIEQYNKIIIHRHENPDPDAIGSQAGLKALIQENYPDKQVFAVGEEEESLTFLAKMDEIDEEMYEGSLVIVCDTANLERVDDKRYERGEALIKIDHHPEVEEYGDVSWVDINSSSVSEMVYELYNAWKQDGMSLSSEVARLLFAGIVGDTGRFRHPNTTEKTFRIAAELTNYTFSRPDLFNEMEKSSLSLKRLEGYVLSNAEILDSGAGYIKLTSSLLTSYDVTSREAGGIINTLSTLEGLKAWVFFVEEEEIIRVRLRSKGPAVNKIASRYNGGGHELAAGAKVSSWNEADQLLAELEEACHKG